MELTSMDFEEILKFSRLEKIAFVSPRLPSSCEGRVHSGRTAPSPAQPSTLSAPGARQDMDQLLTKPDCFGKTRVCHLLARESLRPNHY